MESDCVSVWLISVGRQHGADPPVSVCLHFGAHGRWWLPLAWARRPIYWGRCDEEPPGRLRPPWPRGCYPAAYVGSIAVAATQFDESTTFYSNWGKEITIAAPGGNTRVDQNEDGVPDGVLQNTVTPGNTAKQDYLLFMGTSMASPHVAGVAALLVSEGIRQPAQVAEILQKTSRRPSQYRGKHDTHYGAGIIDAKAAIVEARQQLHAAQKSNDAKGSPWLGLFALGLVAAAVIYRRSRNAMAIAAMDNDSAGS